MGLMDDTAVQRVTGYLDQIDTELKGLIEDAHDERELFIHIDAITHTIGYLKDDIIMPYAISTTMHETLHAIYDEIKGLYIYQVKPEHYQSYVDRARKYLEIARKFFSDNKGNVV